MHDNCRRILESIREISRKLSKVSSAPLIYNAVRTTGTDSDRHRNFEDLVCLFFSGIDGR